VTQRRLAEDIAAHFREQIESGELAPGDRLPTIRDIAEQWSVARETANKAIDSLRLAGLVVTGGRGGTSVAQRDAAVALAVQTPPGTAVAGTEVTEASAEVAEQLGVPEGSPVIIVRLKTP
jgi:DNA-binding GntR family transcriptional regulator